MNADDIYALFQKLDRLPGIMEPRLGRWRAWPAVKNQLYGPLIKPAPVKMERLVSSPVFRRLGRRCHCYQSVLMTALRQYRNLLAEGGGSAKAILMGHSSYHMHDDGVLRDYFFDDLISGIGLPEKPLHFDYPWIALSEQSPVVKGSYSLTPTLAATDIVTKIKYHSHQVKSCTKILLAILQKTDLPFEQFDLAHRIRIALSVFEGRRIVFGKLFKRLKPKVIVLTHAPGHYGEIAAARELHIPVIEIQNGLIGTNDPEYQWPKEYAPFKADMPLPSIISLFGSLHKELLLSNGFWLPSELEIIGCGGIERQRQRVKVDYDLPGSNRPLKLLFMTQSTSREMSVDFFSEFLGNVARKLPFQVQLDIKIHPYEKLNSSAYENLARSFPEQCRVLSEKTYSLDAISDCDVAISYNSLSSIEAISLGVPSVSICGGTIPRGLAGLIEFNNIHELIPHVSSPDGLIDTLLDIYQGPEPLNHRRERLRKYGEGLYEKGFLEAAPKIIRLVMNQN